MRVKVTYLGVVRGKIGKKEEEYNLAEDSSLRDLLDKIVENHQVLRDVITGKDESSIDPTLIITLNGLAIDTASKGGSA